MTTDQFDDIIEDIMTSTWESGRTKIINLCKQMCDRQKEICAIKKDGHNGDPYHSDERLKYYKEVNFIINAPYPEELL